MSITSDTDVLDMLNISNDESKIEVVVMTKVHKKQVTQTQNVKIVIDNQLLDLYHSSSNNGNKTNIVHDGIFSS